MAPTFLGDFGDNPLWFYQQYNSTNSRDGGTSELAVRGAVTPWQSDAGAPPLNETHAAYVLSSFINDVKSNSPFPEASVTDEHIDGLPIGPGTRVPMLICSPWTRGGYVDSNVYDHTSMLQFLATWTGVKPANVTPWRASVTGDLTTAFDFKHPDFSIPGNIPTLNQTWALTQLTGGSTTPPAEGDQEMPKQEPGSRPHRPTNYQLHADVTVNRATSQVTAALTNTGTVGASFAVYPDDYLTFSPTPFTVLRSSPGSYVWDASLTLGKYAFSVYGPDGFLTSFAGEVVPAGVNAGPVPEVTAALRTASKTLELTLANEGKREIVYTLTPNDYEGSTKTVTVKTGRTAAISWPTDHYGYYDVVITTNTADGFRRRYAGRIA
jgi:phospholipase C